MGLEHLFSRPSRLARSESYAKAEKLGRRRINSDIKNLAGILTCRVNPEKWYFKPLSDKFAQAGTAQSFSAFFLSPPPSPFFFARMLLLFFFS